MNRRRFCFLLAVLLGAAGADNAPNLFDNAVSTAGQNWTMTVDPATQPATRLAPGPAFRPFAVKADGEPVRGDGANRLLVLTRFDGWSMWDTAAGAETREVRSRFPLDHPVVSPDGTLVAGQASGRVEIWSLRTGSRVATVGEATKAVPRPVPAPAFPARGMRPLGARGAAAPAASAPVAPPPAAPPPAAPAASATPPTARAFTPDNHLLVSYDQGFDKPSALALVDPLSGKELRRFDIPTAPSDIACSPGGKFAIIALNNFRVQRTAIYNLQSGEFLGNLPDTGVQAIAFSSDGTHFAVYSSAAFHSRLALYSTATGQQVAEVEPKGCQRLNPDSIALQFRPDGGALLLQNIVFDAATLKQLFATPATPTDVHFARWIDDDHLVTLTGGTLEGVAVDRATLGRAAEAIAQGGHAQDAVLSPLAPLTRDHVVEAAPVDAPHAWSPLTPAPPPHRIFVPLLALKPAITPGQAGDRPNYEKPVGILFSSALAHNLFLERAGVRRDPFDRDSRYDASPFQRADTLVERYDLASGTCTAAVHVSPLLSVLDASADGKMLALYGGAGMDRAEFWTDDKNTFKPLLAISPFGTAPEATGERRGEEADPHCVAWASIIDDRHALIMSAGRQLVLVDIPGRAVLWHESLPAAADAVSRALPAVSPDRKYAAVSLQDCIALGDTLTGKALDRIATPGLAWRLQFSPDGSRLAAIFPEAGYDRLCVYDLATGKTLSDFPLPAGDRRQEAPLSFVAGNCILLPAGQLVSLDRKAIIYNYHAAGAPGIEAVSLGSLHRGSVTPYERIFYAAPQGSVRFGRQDNGPEWAIGIADLPHPAAVAAAKSVNVDDLFVVHPGTEVELQLDVVGDADYLQQQRDIWKLRLKGEGLVVVDKSPFQLHVHNYVMSGRTATFRINATNETYTVTPSEAGFEITLNLNNARLWHVDNKGEVGGPPPIDLIHRKAGESAQAAADRAHPPLTQASTILLPPPYIYKNSVTSSASLTAQGIVDDPAVSRIGG